MASTDQVKQYLAFWFQLGKRLVINNGQEFQLPQPVLQGDRYSPEFEACWQRVLDFDGKNCYLEGTVQTLDFLLSSAWEVNACARCDMPVPMLSLGSRSPDCPCVDMPQWPNLDLPIPRVPVDSRSQLDRIRSRLVETVNRG
jgi:hypothetical protein